MVEERQRRVITDGLEEPEPEEVTTEPEPKATTFPSLNLDAQTAYAWGTFLDKAASHAKHFVQMFIDRNKSRAPGAGTSPNGATDNGHVANSEKIIEVKPVTQPRFDIDKLMGIIDEALAFVVSIKGNEPLVNLPPLMAENRELVKGKLQEALNACLITE